MSWTDIDSGRKRPSIPGPGPARQRAARSAHNGIDTDPARPHNVPRRSEPRPHQPSPKGTNTMRQVTIQGVVFDLEDKYEAGHAINENEAGALNQTRAENLRNNFASVVKSAREDAARQANGLADDATPTDDQLNAVEFDEATIDELKSKFNEVADKYEFGARGGGLRTTDPVEREAKRIAREKVEVAIREKYGKLSAVASEKITELVHELAQREDIVALAKSNVESAKSIAADLEI